MRIAISARIVENRPSLCKFKKDSSAGKSCCVESGHKHVYTVSTDVQNMHTNVLCWSSDLNQPIVSKQGD